LEEINKGKNPVEEEDLQSERTQPLEEINKGNIPEEGDLQSERTQPLEEINKGNNPEEEDLQSERTQPLEEINKGNNPEEEDLQSERTCYYANEKLPGTEDLYNEYKQGGCLLNKKLFVQIIQRYACAFLNSEGGVLYSGVNDNGIVKGVHISSEDWNMIKETVKLEIEKFRPFVPESLYSVKKIPVVDKTWYSAHAATLAVVKFVFKKGIEGELYENAYHLVYLKRDGYVFGPLGPLRSAEKVEILLQRQKRDKRERRIEKER